MDQAATAEQARLDAVAVAEQARRDAVAAAEVEAIRARTETTARQTATEQVEQVRQRRNRERERAREARRQRRGARGVRLRAWAVDHVVDLLIYPLAVVSAVMAVPAMAAFGHDVYGSAAGYALPVITELGMWAFALAVQHTRRRHPGRAVWALQLGVWAFAAVAAVLNFLHGLLSDTTEGLIVGLISGAVMAVASVAGVMAHQLVTAAPRQGRAERGAARKVARMRRAAVRAAVAEIGVDGAARLVFAPGRYSLRRRWGRGRRLQPGGLAGLPVTPVLGSDWDEMDHALAALLADPNLSDPDGRRPSQQTGPVAGPVGTLDRDRDQQTPSPDRPTDRPADRPTDRSEDRPRDRGGNRRAKRARRTRSIEELRAEFRAAIEADPGSIDPGSAESIRTALRCSPARARQLRDEYQTPGNDTRQN